LFQSVVLTVMLQLNVRRDRETIEDARLITKSSCVYLT